MVNKKYYYDLDGLMYVVKPFKIKLTDLKKDQLFLNISRGYPKTLILVERVKEIHTQVVRNKHTKIDKKEVTIITVNDNSYMDGNKGIYRYDMDLHEILQNWFDGYNLIEDIHKDLIQLNIFQLKEIKEHINFLKMGDTKHG